MSLYQAMVNRFVTPVIEARRNEGRAEGRVKGRAEGRAEGDADGGHGIAAAWPPKPRAGLSTNRRRAIGRTATAPTGRATDA